MSKCRFCGAEYYSSEHYINCEGIHGVEKKEEKVLNVSSFPEKQEGLPSENTPQDSPIAAKRPSASSDSLTLIYKNRKQKLIADIENLELANEQIKLMIHQRQLMKILNNPDGKIEDAQLQQVPVNREDIEREIIGKLEKQNKELMK